MCRDVPETQQKTLNRQTIQRKNRIRYLKIKFERSQQFKFPIEHIIQRGKYESVK